MSASPTRTLLLGRHLQRLWKALLACAVVSLAPLGSQQRFLETQLHRDVLVWSLAPADIDADGDLDVIEAVLSGVSGPMLRVYVNDGDGQLTEETALRVPKLGYTFEGVVRVGDVDGDKDLDIVAGNGIRGSWSTRFLLLNDGKGVFRDVSAKQMPQAWTFDAADMELVDIDGDCDLDLVLAIHGNPTPQGLSLIYVNDGKGFFTDETSKRLPAVQHAIAVEAGDLDGDGDADLMFSHNLKVSSPNALYENNGKGVFTRSTKYLPYWEPTNGLLLRDFDGDGDLDAFLFAHLTDKLYLNDGKGNFKDESWRLPKPNGYFGSGYAVAADIDGNGALDLIVTASGGISYPDHWNFYLNDGRARFTLIAAGIPRRLGGSGSLAAADLDGDRDVDVLAARGFHFPPLTPPILRIWSNLDRHLVTPVPPQLGRTYSLELFSLRAPALILPYMAAGRARIPVPGIGVFRLDPGTAVALGAYVLKTSGKLTLPLLLPQDRRLLGLTLSSQAVVYETTAQRFSGLTNALSHKVQ